MVEKRHFLFVFNDFQRVTRVTSFSKNFTQPSSKFPKILWTPSPPPPPPPPRSPLWTSSMNGPRQEYCWFRPSYVLFKPNTFFEKSINKLLFDFFLIIETAEEASKQPKKVLQNYNVWQSLSDSPYVLQKVFKQHGLLWLIMCDHVNLFPCLFTN